LDITPYVFSAKCNQSGSRQQQIKLIQRGKNLGFTLEEIRDWLALYDADPNHITQARVMMIKVDLAVADLVKKRADIERAIKDLREIKTIAVEHLKSHED